MTKKLVPLGGLVVVGLKIVFAVLVVLGLPVTPLDGKQAPFVLGPVAVVSVWTGVPPDLPVPPLPPVPVGVFHPDWVA